MRQAAPARSRHLVEGLLTLLVVPLGMIFQGHSGADTVPTDRIVGPAVFAHPAPPRFALALFSATPSIVAGTGGSVTLDVVATGATSCTFSSPFGSTTKRCTSGTVDAVRVPASTSAHVQVLHFGLLVSAPHVQRSASVTVVQEPRPGTPLAPVVVLQPVSATVAVGATATFRVGALGAPQPAVSWQTSSNGGASWSMVSGRSAVLQVRATSKNSGTEYRAVFSNSLGAAKTSPARLTGTKPGSGGGKPHTPPTTPPVTTEPTTPTTTAPAEPTTTTTAPADPTTTTVTSPPTTTTPTTTTTTTTTTAPVPEAPSVTTEPSNETVVSGSNASFSAAASGTPAPTVQWQVSTNGGSTWAAVSGATSATYSFQVVNANNGWQYRAVFTNSAGSVPTNAATLTVTAPPGLTAQPSNVTVASGGNASFTAAASGLPSPTVQWQVSTNGGGTWGNISGATSDAYSFTASSTENLDEYQAVFTNTFGSATSSEATLLIVDTSNNWSGYADTGSTFTAVTGDWTVPTVICGSGNLYSSAWIGIDGYASSTVEQDGTEADCVSGTPQYDAWYEMYGDNSVNHGAEVQLTTSTHPVHPGDAMTASVSEASNNWTLAISDTTQSWSFSIQISFSAGRTSAEWIVERPEVGSSLSNLADYGTTTFTGGTASTTSGAQPINAVTDVALEMIGASDTLSEPSLLDHTGESFTCTWEASS